MAQPLFDEHPLGDYFRQTGEFAEPMPGSSADFVLEEQDLLDVDDSSVQAELELPRFVQQAAQFVNNLLQSSTSNSTEDNFAERFKYDVISSSLLASTLAAVPSSAVRQTFSPDIPGKLDDSGGGDKPESTPADVKTESSYPLNADSITAPDSLGIQSPYVLASLAALALSTNHVFLAILLLCAAAYVRYVVNTDSEKSDTTKQTLESVNELISAGNVWDSSVNEAMMLIENEERSIFYGPTSSQAPSSALRLALQSSLQTTQTQCDNVRHLLSALTSPTSLSQISEMYAPPSPVRPPLTLLDPPRSPLASNTIRPFSLPFTTPLRHRTTSFPITSPTNKRATWNGSHAALALSGSPTSQMLKRKQMNRRSDLASLFQPVPTIASVSAPVSPQPPSPTKGALENLTEEDDPLTPELESKSYFGAAALDLQRKRRSAALETFGIPPPSYASSADFTEPPLRSPVRASHSRNSSGISPTFSSSSRFTPVHTTRHPLSLSGLHGALHGALSAKRYTCSHLLALRFNEDEDDTYWENVRSVMALLTSTFADASSRLVEALDDAEKRRIKDEHPTPPSGPHNRESSISPLRNQMGGERNRLRSMAEMVSFAPMPSNMSRFGVHVDAISGALNDARDHLEECVAALRDSSSRRQSFESSDGEPSVQDHPAFQAYDRLRKELGFALRECERGRERMLDILAGPRALTEVVEDEDVSPHTPGLRQDSGSESSEKGPISPNAQLDGDEGLGLEFSPGRDGQEHELDDATAHLLLATSSQHLPPPGAEQVFEAESGAGASFARERSKLSREERIRLAKARRSSGVPSLASSDGGAERQPRVGPWGPNGEVVQELKDVIWKVGEKRRKFSERLEAPLSKEEEPGAEPVAVSVEAGASEEDESVFMRELSRPAPIDTLRTGPPAAAVAAAGAGEEADMS
ncbi:hypothetical protein TRAPUB_9959 [Trametes pubescens]|uniref:Myosin-binding domain-containing protein n=1 Tax=Trametes pubescens TaxID=154538 RepID=A0A1M2W0W7_TRAPU|nr:hypothetical protein TRAPUB_9959 [Trametes pubescens]